MTTFLLILALVLGLIGLAGAVLPVLPGTVLSYLGLLCLGFVPESSVGTSVLLTWALVALVVIVSDYFLPGYFSKLCGGTKAGITGATIGAILGVFFPERAGHCAGPVCWCCSRRDGFGQAAFAQGYRRGAWGTDVFLCRYGREARCRHLDALHYCG